MATLESLGISVTDMSDEELQQTVLGIRQSRAVRKARQKTRKQAAPKNTIDGMSKDNIMKLLIALKDAQKKAETT